MVKFWILLSMQTVFHVLSVDAAVPLALAADACRPPTEIECGRQGWGEYTEAKCVEDNRCCWNKNHIPNCYYKATAELPGPQCLVDVQLRVECGNFSTKPQQCLDRGCCWNATAVGKWCYHASTTTTTIATTPLPPTTIVTADPIIRGTGTCKCSIQADPVVTRFDGAKKVIRGAEPVVLYYSKEHQITVKAVLAHGTGILAKMTVLDLVIISKGSAENKLVLTRDGVKTFGDAPKYDVISASHPLGVKLRSDPVIMFFEFNYFWAKFVFEVPYDSYYNDEGVCGVCPAVQG